MKRIIYPVVTALILGVILTLVIPKWIFQGDARWTYQNDAACVDVSLRGHLKNGRVDTEGMGMRVTKPARLSNEGSQGTMVEIPVSYCTKSYQLRLSPKADAWGEDAVLVIEFKGKDFQHRGKRRAAWVSFRNITLDGQPVAEEKVVWHNKPFVLEYPLHSSSECTLTFDLCKPLAASDISLVNPLALFFVCLLLGLFPVPLKRVANHTLSLINERDIVKMVSDGYHHIDPVYRRSFWIIFGVLCFAFGFHTIQFMWGNHDWSLLNSSQQWLSYAWCGRYMINAVKIPLSDGIYLPLIHDLIIFVTLAINAVLLCKYWRLEKRVSYYVLCGLVLTAQPFTLGMMYFVHTTPEVFIGVICVLGSLLLSDKIATKWGMSLKGLFFAILSIVLINFALATYPVLINTIAVAFVGRLLVQSFDWDGSWSKIKSYLAPFIVSSINIVLGIASYKLIVTFVFPVRPFYNTDTLPLVQVPERLGVLLKQSIHQLYEYDMPFLPQWILWVFLGLTIILGIYVCLTGNLKQKIIRLSLLFISLLATQTAMLIARTHLIDGRVELFGLVFFEVLVVALVLTRLRKLHNISVTACTCVIFAFVINDLDCLRVWKLGFDAEKMLWNRVLARLEIQKGFNATKKYDIVQIGGSISMRPRFSVISRKFRSGLFMLNGSYNIGNHPFEACEFYYPTRFRGTCYSPTVGNRGPSYQAGYEAMLKRLYQAGVLQKAEVWPKPNGLIVWKDIILFVTDGKELAKYKKQFERELGKK